MTCPMGHGAPPVTVTAAAAEAAPTGPYPRGGEPQPTYSSYLALDKVLDAQFPRSRVAGEERHDEMLFIIVHQCYELWFKQVLHDVDSVLGIFHGQQMDDRMLSVIEQRLSRVNEIFKLLSDQFRVLLTMLPHQFLGFRKFLGTSSGFQSVQFRVLELKLGLRDGARVAFAHNYRSALGAEEENLARQTPGCPEGGGSLVERVDAWLLRMPFMQSGNFDWWTEYQRAAHQMFDEELVKALSEPTLAPADKRALVDQSAQTRQEFEEIFDERQYNARKEHHRLSYQAFKAALLISLYRQEPVFQMPHLVLTRLIEVDEGLSTWRWRHAQMVRRILGSKLGTGGSSGAAYLAQTATPRYRVFADLSNMSTYMIPAERLPALPQEIIKAMSFVYSSPGPRL